MFEIMRQTILLLTLTLVTSLSDNQLIMPLGFTIHRLADPSILFTAYMEKLGISMSTQTQNKIASYNLIALDGYKYGTAYENKMTPLTLYRKPFQHILANKGSIYGNTNDEVRKYILQKMHEKKKKLLMNVDLKMAPISSSAYDATKVAEDVVQTLFTLSLGDIDGISVQFEDYHAVYENTASLWLETFLLTIRKKISDSGFIIVLSLPATFVSKIKLFRTELANALVTYFILQYYGTTENTYTDYATIFTSSLSKYRPSAVFELSKATDIYIDACRLLVAKPADSRALWNRSQYVSSSVLGQMFQRAYNQMGWFGGYANMDFESDSKQEFANAVLSSLQRECKLIHQCIC